MDLGDFLFAMGDRIKWRAKNIFVVHQMNKLEYIEPSRENFRGVDMTKDSTGKRSLTTYPIGGISAV